MLNYQSTSFHDANYLRQVMGLRRAPEFEAWLQKMQRCDEKGRLSSNQRSLPLPAYLEEMDR